MLPLLSLVLACLVCFAGSALGVTQTYTNGNTYTVDFGSTSSVIMVPGFGTISDVNVVVDVQTVYFGDVNLFLSAPSASSAALTQDQCGQFRVDGPLTFDDEVPYVLTCSGPTPFSGNLSPEDSLTTFDGQEMNGAWILSIVDDYLTYATTVRSFSLTIDFLAVMAGDPHCVGFGSQRFNFDGDLGVPYSAVSTRDSQMNVVLGNFAASSNPERRYVVQAGFLLADGTTIEVLASPDQFRQRAVILVDGSVYAHYDNDALTLLTDGNSRHPSIHLHGLSDLPKTKAFATASPSTAWMLDWTYGAVSIVAGEARYTVLLVDTMNYPEAPHGRGYTTGILNIVVSEYTSWSSVSSGVSFHGILGQTLAAGEANQARDGSFQLQGSLSDYVTGSLLGIAQEASFNRFQLQA